MSPSIFLHGVITEMYSGKHTGPRGPDPSLCYSVWPAELSMGNSPWPWQLNNPPYTPHPKPCLEPEPSTPHPKLSLPPVDLSKTFRWMYLCWHLCNVCLKKKEILYFCLGLSFWNAFSRHSFKLMQCSYTESLYLCKKKCIITIQIRCLSIQYISLLYKCFYEIYMNINIFVRHPSVTWSS